MVAYANLHLIEGLIERPLADDVDHAANVALSVKDGWRSFQNLDALGAIGLDLRHGPGVVVSGEKAVDEISGLVGIEAADADPIEPGVQAPDGRHDARGVSQGLVDAGGRLLRDAIGRHDRNGLRRLDQRRVCLGAGGAAGGDDAVDRTCSCFAAYRNWGIAAVVRKAQGQPLGPVWPSWALPVRSSFSAGLPR